MMTNYSVLHTISEWEDKRPFNVEYLHLKLKHGRVETCVARCASLGRTLVYDGEGRCEVEQCNIRW